MSRDIFERNETAKSLSVHSDPTPPLKQPFGVRDVGDLDDSPTNHSVNPKTTSETTINTINRNPSSYPVVTSKTYLAIQANDEDDGDYTDDSDIESGV
jgi:hypothetical protein